MYNPHLGAEDRARIQRMKEDEEEEFRSGQNTFRKKRLASPDLWESRQLISSGVLPVTEYPNFDAEHGTGVLQQVDVEEEVEIELNDIEPHFLKGQTKILLQRNLGRGKKIEGLEVRWGNVARIVRALTMVGDWREGEPAGPMHKYYVQRLFRLMSEADVLAQYAPKGVDGNPIDACTADGLVAAGFDDVLWAWRRRRSRGMAARCE